MRLRNFFHIVWANLFEKKGRTFSAMFVIAFVVSVVMVIGSLTLGFFRGVLEKAEEAFPAGMLVVKPAAVNIAMIALQTGAITEDNVQKMRAMPDVDFVAPQVALKMPLHAQAELLGQQAVTEALIVGIDPVLVEEETVVAPFAYDEATSLPIPCILPRYFLDMYNLAYAESMGLPKINEDYIVGRGFTLFAGESLLMGDALNPGKRKAQLECKIVGLTSNPSLVVGLLIPIGHARELNRWYTGREIAQYTALHVKVKNPDRLKGIAEAIRDMGYRVESQQEMLEKFQFIVRSAALVTAVFAAVIAVIAAVCIFNTFSLIMSERRGEVGMLRAVGGGRGVVTSLFIVEIALIGLLAGVAGAVTTWALIEWADHQLLRRLPDVSFLPETLLLLNYELVLACIGGAMLLSILSALPVILRTTRTQPAVLVSEA